MIFSAISVSLWQFLRWAILLLLALGCVPSPASAAQVVVLVEPASLYQQAARGFQQGFGDPAAIRLIRLNGDVRERDQTLADLRRTNPTLVVAIGTQTARAARQKLPGVPVLYCLALSPRQNGLVGADVGGVALDVEVSQQFRGIQRALPDVRRIGVIYNELTSGRLVKEAGQYVKNGARLVLQPVSTPQEAARAIADVLGKVDAFWLLWDPVIMNPANFRLLVDYSLKNKVALIVPEVPFVESGGLLSVRADYVKAGERAGKMARQILEGKKRAGDFAAEPPPASVLTINGSVARRLGRTIPPDLLAEILSPGGNSR